MFPSNYISEKKIIKNVYNGLFYIFFEDQNRNILTDF